MESRPRSLGSRLLICAAVALIGYGVGGLLTGRMRPRFQHLADTTPWTWSYARATATYCATQPSGRYRVQLVVPADSPSTWMREIVVWDGTRKAYTWTQDGSATFRIVGNRLYRYAIYDSYASQTDVVAVHLETGAVLWHGACFGVGLGRYAAYKRDVNIEADEQKIEIFGDEPAGQDLEIKDTQTGRTLGHRTYSRRFFPLPRWPGADVLLGTPWLKPWMVKAAFAAPGVIGVLGVCTAESMRRRRAMRCGLCPKCSYDIRATPTRCPECGTDLGAR